MMGQDTRRVRVYITNEKRPEMVPTFLFWSGFVGHNAALWKSVAIY